MHLPSGGFSNQSLKGFFEDVFPGVLGVNFKNWVYVRKSAKDGDCIIAIGDLLPLVFAWSSGATFGFIGTPKSDYTWLTFQGIRLSDYYHEMKGTE